MNKANFPYWDNETEKAVNEINRVTAQIKSVQEFPHIIMTEIARIVRALC